MLLIMCTKFQINRIILTLFSGVWDKNPLPVAEKVVKCHRQKHQKSKKKLHYWTNFKHFLHLLQSPSPYFEAKFQILLCSPIQ